MLMRELSVINIHTDLNINLVKEIGRSEKSLKEYDGKFRLNSNKWEIKKENYIRIDNTDMSPEETAKKIKESFQL